MTFCAWITERSRSPVARGEKSEDPLLAKLEEIFAAGTVKKEDIGDEFVEELRGLKEEEAFYVIDRVRETDFKTVRRYVSLSLRDARNGFIVSYCLMEMQPKRICPGNNSPC